MGFGPVGNSARLACSIVKPRNESRQTAIAGARTTLAQAPNRDAIVAAFVEWWRHPSHTNPEGLDDSNSRPSTEYLAARLREPEREDLAAFAEGPWLKQGPLDPTLWQFAILAGESFVEPFAEALKAGNWREPRFFGLDAMGAWEAFDLGLRETFRADATAAHAALGRLRTSVETARRDPTGTMPQDDRYSAHVKERIKRYQDSPHIDEVFEQPSDIPTWPECVFLWDVLLDVRPQETMELLARMPHPLLMRSCLGSDRLAGRPEELARLIAAAPRAFDGELFQGAGALVILLLEQAWVAIESTAHNPDGSLVMAPIDKPVLLNPSADKCRAVTQTVLDALFLRDDAVPLAWAWLEQMVSYERVRGVPAAAEARLHLNLPMLAIHPLAARLHARADYNEWVKQRQELWQIYRLCAVVAVAAFGQAPDVKQISSILEWALLEGVLTYSGIGNAMANPADVVAAIGGKAICALEDPVAWFNATWQRLRPIRERNWQMGIVGDNYLDRLTPTILAG